LKRIAFYWGASTALFSSTVCATPIVLPDAASLAREANLVVVGRVESTSVGRTGADSRTVSLVVDRVLDQKSPLGGNRVDYEYSYADPDASGPVKNSYGVFFLKCAENGACRPVSAAMQYSVARPEFAGPGRLTGSTTDLVAAEMVNAIAQPGSTEDLRSSAVRELSDLPLTAPLRDELVEVVRRGDAASRLAASAVLVSGGDISTVDLISADVVNPPQGCDALVSLAAVNVRSLQKVEPSSISTWSRWLRSSNVEVRRGAASALSNIRSKEAAKVLARQALDDADNDVLFYAVSSLIVNIGDSRHPVMDRFEKDPEFYRRRWQAWRQKNLN